MKANIKPAPLLERAQDMLYGTSASARANEGTISHTVHTYVQRRVNSINARPGLPDRESVRIAREEGPKIEAWATRNRISPRDLNELLSMASECEDRRIHYGKPISAEVHAERADLTRELIRIESGSAEAGQARIKRVVALMADLQSAIPPLADRLDADGAVLHPRVVRALDHYDVVAASTPPPKAAPDESAPLRRDSADVAGKLYEAPRRQT